MDGRPHKITELIRKYILQNNSINIYDDKFISPTCIDRAICDIIANTLGINKWLIKNLNVPWPAGLKKRAFNIEVIKWVQSELGYDDEKIKFLWKRTQNDFNKASEDKSWNKLAKPKGRKARRGY